MSDKPPPNSSPAGHGRDPAAQAPPPLPDESHPAPDAAPSWLAARARQTWLNFQVWLPPLMNPPTKAREVVYWARQHRERGVWEIALPAQCWQCGAQHGLQHADFEFDVRSFDNALAILIGFGGLLAFMGLLSFFMGSTFLILLTAMLALAAAGVLYLKSWKESIHIVVNACGQHAGDVRAPEAVVEQEELHLFLANDALAGATRLALQEERRGRAMAVPGGGVAPQAPSPAPSGMPLPSASAPPTYSRPIVPELPPIKLDGDE